MSEILDKLKQYGILEIEKVSKDEVEFIDPKDDKFFLSVNKKDLLQLSQELKAYVETDDQD